jgi:asparagine synthase (glutamine-hydrolysing)
LNDYIALCHRRLSIIDLTIAGNQPMVSNDGKYVITFNGEIYNYLEIKKCLHSHNYKFKSKTDTEVILALYQIYGFKCLDMLNGMFAFAIWDNVKKILFIARDRIGKKPLYYFDNNKYFIFASEIKSILKHPVVDISIRPDSIYDYFSYQYIPDPKTIYKNIYKLKPAHYLVVKNNKIYINQYWDVSFKLDESSNESIICNKLNKLLTDSTKYRMVSDVTLGAFLSGGIDSSAIVALMSRISDSPITTCSIGFNNNDYNEIDYANSISNIFNTTHNIYKVKNNIYNNLMHISSFFDEPFADPSFVPTYYVSRLARRTVKVALSGDGGDENFAGYQKYLIDDIEQRLRKISPYFISKQIFPVLSRLLSHSNNRILIKGSSLLKSLSKSPSYAYFLTNSFFQDDIWNMIIDNNFSKDISGYHPSLITEQYYNNADTDNHLSKILYTDIKTYLPGDILVKVDRMSMANSLEVRAPFLDYNVVDFAAKIPSHLKYKHGQKKYILKRCLKNILPNEILQRKKMGFSVPLAHWLRHEIYEFAYSHIFQPNNGLSYFFKIDKINDLWKLHQSSNRDYSNQIWSLLIFELWWKHYIDK